MPRLMIWSRSYNILWKWSLIFINHTKSWNSRCPYVLVAVDKDHRSISTSLTIVQASTLAKLMTKPGTCWAPHAHLTPGVLQEKDPSLAPQCPQFRLSEIALNTRGIQPAGSTNTPCRHSSKSICFSSIEIQVTDLPGGCGRTPAARVNNTERHLLQRKTRPPARTRASRRAVVDPPCKKKILSSITYRVINIGCHRHDPVSLVHLYLVREIAFIWPIVSLDWSIPERSHFTGEDLGPSDLLVDALEAIKLEGDIGLVNPAAHVFIETQLTVKTLIGSSRRPVGAY